MELVNKTGVIFPKEVTRTRELDEGDYKVAIGYDILTGMPRMHGTWTKQVDEENFLKTAGDNTSKLPEAGEIATGYCQYYPEAKAGLPNENRTKGNYTPRHVGVSTLVPMAEVPLPLDPKNVAIKAGDRLEIKNPKTGLDKSAATNNTCEALQDVPANTGGYILVALEGSLRVKP